jgi:heme exporter protein A
MLEVLALSARRGSATLFDAVSFRLDRGQALLLSGPNGSGKTTLLRIVAGLTECAGGSLEWRGARTAPFDAALRSAALFIGHAPALKDEFSTEENLASLASLHGAATEPAALLAALSAWSLSRQRGLPARVLSQGQRRRTSLARLQLVSRPLWLLDEPAAALDDAGMATLGAALAAHLAEGGIAVIATHQDLPLAAGVTQSLRLA